MDFDFNEDLRSDILIAVVVVENIGIHQGGFNIICDKGVVDAEPEVLVDISGDGSGESEVHEWDLNIVCDDGERDVELEVVLDIVGQGSRESKASKNSLVSAPAVGDDLYYVEKAHDFWKLHGFQTKFGICNRTSYKKGGNVVTYRLQCTKFREKREKVEDGEPFPERRRLSENSICKVF